MCRGASRDCVQSVFVMHVGARSRINRGYHGIRVFSEAALALSSRQIRHESNAVEAHVNVGFGWAGAPCMYWAIVRICQKSKGNGTDFELRLVFEKCRRKL